MGERGPLKLPPALKVVPRADSERTAAETTAPGRPRKPGKLPAGASKLWDELVEALDGAGLLSSVDGPALELALRHYVVAVKASNELLRGDAAVPDELNGRSAKNPASQVFRDHSMAFAEYMKQMGLSFAARARVSSPKEDGRGAANPFSQLG